MSRRGTPEIDRRFGRLGRVRVASGTHDRALLKKLNGMLTVLHESRPDVLIAIRDRRVTPLEVWAYFREGQLAALPLAPEAMLAFRPTFGRWVDDLRNAEGRPASQKHKASLRLSLGHLEARARTVSDLPAALAAARGRILPAHPRTFMLVKAAVQAFLRDLVGKHHPLYLAAADVPSVRVRRRQRGGVPIDSFRRMVAQLEPEYAAQAWAMAGTGMGPDEYLGRKFEPRGDRLLIHGTKREARDRVVPLVVPVAGPFTAYRALRLALAEVGLQPYDLRRTFAHWCDEAGIRRTRIKLYMGHSLAAEDVTGGYLHHEVRPYLKADGERLRAYIGSVRVALKLEKRA